MHQGRHHRCRYRRYSTAEPHETAVADTSTTENEEASRSHPIVVWLQTADDILVFFICAVPATVIRMHHEVTQDACASPTGLRRCGVRRRPDIDGTATQRASSDPEQTHFSHRDPPRAANATDVFVRVRQTNLATPSLRRTPSRRIQRCRREFSALLSFCIDPHAATYAHARP